MTKGVTPDLILYVCYVPTVTSFTHMAQPTEEEEEEEALMGEEEECERARVSAKMFC